MAVGSVASQPRISDPELKMIEKASIEKLFPEKTRLTLVRWQIIITAIAVVLQVIIVAIDDDGWQIALAGIGICSALCFGITGGVGLVASARASRKSIKLIGVMSIVCTIFAVTLIAICMARIRQCYRDGQSGKSFLFCLILLTGFVECIVAIMTATFACRVGPICSPKAHSYETRMTTSGQVAIPMTVDLPMTSKQ